MMHESQTSASDTTRSWTVPRQKEVKKLDLKIEARFLFMPLGTEKVDFGGFLSKFREVGDVTFVPQKVRTLNEGESDEWLTLPRLS